MFTTGLNDTRVDSWQPAKAAARMQSAGSPNPVLLRVEANVGHGPGATKAQDDALAADIAAFLFGALDLQSGNRASSRAEQHSATPPAWSHVAKKNHSRPLRLVPGAAS